MSFFILINVLLNLWPAVGHISELFPAYVHVTITAFYMHVLGHPSLTPQIKLDGHMKWVITGNKYQFS